MTPPLGTTPTASKTVYVRAVVPAGKAHRDRISARSALIRARKIANHYGRQLRKIARHVEDITKGFDAATDAGRQAIRSHLARYAEILGPWAEATGERMVAEVADADANRWRRMSAEIGRGIEREIQSAPIAPAMAQMKAEQVRLITSLPTEAAERVNRLVTEGIAKGTRAETIAAQIYETGQVTKSRASLIARTEVGRVATTLQAARAQRAGSTQFKWVSAGDSDVRPSHKRLNGKVFSWTDPPICDDPDIRALPGAVFNCFTGDTQVSLGNGIRKIWRAPFHGQVVEIVTALGSTTATLNHPILTQRGWVSAGEIDQGDYLVQALNDAHFVVNRDKDQPLPTFDQVFGAFQSAYATQRKSRFGFDFHGDVADSDVDEIAIDDLLPNDFVSQGVQRRRNLAFPNSDRTAFAVASGRVDKVVGPNSPSACDKVLPFLSREATHSQAISGATATDVASVSFEPAFDNAARNVEMLGQSKDAFSGNVPLDDQGFGEFLSVVGGPTAPAYCDTASPEFLAEHIRIDADLIGGILHRGTRRYKLVSVSDKRIRNFAGHVYTIETFSGWYSMASAGFIAKNCRCIAVPIFDD